MVNNSKKFKFKKQNCTNIHDVYSQALKISNNNNLDTENINQESEFGQKKEGGLGNNGERIRLYLWHFNQCDSKRCTGKKLLRSGVISPLSMSQKFTGIVLSPYAKTMFSLNDVDLVRNRGIAVIDCSWNKLEETPISTLQAKNTRLLPFLVAANPTHFGRPYQLSCAEALASALYISNFKSHAKSIMSHFNWGETFIEINLDAFELYSTKGHTSDDIEQLQDEYLESEKNKLDERRFMNSVDYQDISDIISH